MAEHLCMAAKEVKILNERLIPFIKKIVYGKTSIQKEMLGGKMLGGKCPFRVVRTSDENFWKVS